MFEAIVLPFAGLVFALASGLLGAAGIVLFWLTAFSVALVVSLAIVAVEYIAAKIGAAVGAIARAAAAVRRGGFAHQLAGALRIEVGS